MERQPGDPIRLIYVIAPIVVAIIGGAGVAGVTQSEEIRDRYQLAADVLLWASITTLLIAMLAALYPIALERQALNVSRFLLRRIRAFVEKRHFSKWVDKWSEYSSLLYRAASIEENRIEEWQNAQNAYEHLREWLMANSRFLPSDAPDYVRSHVAAQWDKLTDKERDLGRGSRGFFAFYSQVEFDMQMIELLMAARDRRHPSRSLSSIWDGLSAYSISRSWRPLRQGGWRTQSGESNAQSYTEEDQPHESS